VSLDFFTVSTVRFKVLFVLIILAHDRRRIVHFNITERPTTRWTGQQVVEAFPWDTAPRFLLRDRDGFYGMTSAGGSSQWASRRWSSRRGVRGNRALLHTTPHAYVEGRPAARSLSLLPCFFRGGLSVLTIGTPRSCWAFLLLALARPATQGTTRSRKESACA
jgi:hypothetical protein